MAKHYIENLKVEMSGMDSAEIVQLIHTNLLRRGEGKEGDPIRVIDQYWTLDGQLLFEIDAYKNEKRKETK
jgi:hypothetical protein